MSDTDLITEATEILKFYANHKNWKDTHKSPRPFLRMVSTDDCEIMPDRSKLGGMRARQFLAKLGVDYDMDTSN